MRITKVLVCLAIGSLVAAAGSAQTGVCVAGNPDVPGAQLCIEGIVEAGCDAVPEPVPSAWTEGLACADLSFPAAGTCAVETFDGLCAESSSEEICSTVGGIFTGGATCGTPPVPTVPRGGQVILLTLLLAGASLFLMRKRIASEQI